MAKPDDEVSPAIATRIELVLRLPSRGASTRVLVAVVAFLTAASLAAHLYGHSVGYQRVPGAGDIAWRVLRLFDTDQESTVATWFASISLLMCAGLLGLIAAERRMRAASHTAHWAGLAIVFLVLSIDEIATVHERVSVLFTRSFGWGGFLTYAWVVPATAFVAVFTAVYLPFLIHLPPRIRTLFLVAGVLYVGGAVGMEAVTGYLDERFGKPSIQIAVAATIEEGLEMSGVVVLIYALLLHIEQHVGVVRIRVGR